MHAASRVVRLIFGVPFDRALWFHALATGIAGVMWAVASRRRLSLSAMNGIDLGTAWLICASYGRTADGTFYCAPSVDSSSHHMGRRLTIEQ